MTNEYREEAERLRQLPRAEQRAIVELHRTVAGDAGVSETNRNEARRRARTLERLLKLKPKKPPKQS